MRDGRARRRAQARSAGAAPAVLFGPRPERGPALHQQAAARMLPPGRGGVRLGQAQPRAALDARRQRAGRLGHGDRHLGSAADADRGAHRADRQRPRGGLLRHLRHRHRHLHDHGAGRGRHARPAARQCQHQARRLDAAAIAGRRRIVDRGLGVATRSWRRADAVREELLRLAKTMPNSPLADAERWTTSRSRTARSCSKRDADARGVDRGRDAARRRGPHRAGEDHQLRQATASMRTTRIRRSSPR